MPNCEPFQEFIENELNMEVLAAPQVERLRRRSETIAELLTCLEKLRRLRSAYCSYGPIPPKDSRGLR